MPTSPDAVRGQLAEVTAATALELHAVAEQAPDNPVKAAIDALRLIVPSYYDAAGSLALAWYEELRDSSQPSSVFLPQIIGNPTTDWIEREVASFQKSLEADLESEMQRILDETVRLAEKEVARGFRASVIGNAHVDEDAIGWSRVARPGACKLCVMLADKGAVYSEDTAIFAAHKSCNCAARPEFRGGEHGPEASVVQYVASRRRAKDDKAQAARNARLRAYLNRHYPDAPG